MPTGMPQAGPRIKSPCLAPLANRGAAVGGEPVNRLEPSGFVV